VSLGWFCTELPNEVEVIMAKQKSKAVSVLEFRCLAPLRFYEHCAACARFGEDCPDLSLIKELLRGNKDVAYGEDVDKNGIPVSAFTCLAPLSYVERSRSRCPHEHRCREEGLLLALLEGRKVLDYSLAKVIKLPPRHPGKEIKIAA
jgi:hypothetical protein